METNKYYLTLVLIATLAYIATIVTATVLHTELLHLATQQGSVSQIFTNNNTTVSWYYILITIIEVIILVAIFKYIKPSWLQLFYALSSYLVLATATFYLINIYASLISPLYSFILSVIGVALITYLFYKYRMQLFNLYGFIIAVGMGSVVSLLFTPLLALIFLGIMAIYDYIAVFKVKIMTKMAQLAITASKPAPMLFITGDIKTIIKRLSDIRCINCHAVMEIVKKDKDTTEYICPNCHRDVLETKGTIKIIYKGDNVAEVPVPKPMGAMLGLGDVIIPSLVMGSYAVQGNPLWVFALAGAVIGLLANLLWLNKIKKAIPALPLIFVGMIISLTLGSIL